MVSPDSKSTKTGTGPGRRMRLSYLLPLIAFLALAGFAAVALMATLRGDRDMSQLPSAMIGKTAPDIILPIFGQEGTATGSVSQLAGKPILVNFFASWCAPCRAEAPALALLAEEIDILGIAYKDRPVDTQKFFAQFGNPFVLTLIDRDGNAGMQWGVYGVPETYLIDAEGRIILRHPGPIDRRVLDEVLRPAIAELK